MLLYVDVIDACHLKCPTCARGVRAFPNTARKMPLDMFRVILAKAKANLERIAALRRAGEIATEVTVRLLLFDYNRAEEAPLRAYVDALGLRFEALVASGHPIDAPQAPDLRAQIIARLAQFSPERPHEPPGMVCPLIFEHVTLDAAGDVYQCTAYGNHDILRIGPYLSLSREEVLFRRYTQPVCNSCSWGRRTASGAEQLLLQQALAQRVGLPIRSRVPQLSRPVGHRPLDAEGHMVPKSEAWRQHGAGTA